MKKILLIIFILLSTVFIPLPAYAQSLTDSGTPSFEYFNVEVYSTSQSAWNKDITLYVKFRATIDSDRVEITWDSPSGATVIPKHPQFVKVKAGQTYTYRALLRPKAAGSYNIAANVISWQYNTNYTSSGSMLIKINDKLLTEPMAANYIPSLIIMWVLVVIGVAAGGFGLYIFALRSKKKFDKWFNLPD